MEKDSEKKLSDYTFEEFKKLDLDDQYFLEDEADETGEWDAWVGGGQEEAEESLEREGKISGGWKEKARN